MECSGPECLEANGHVVRGSTGVGAIGGTERNWLELPKACVEKILGFMIPSEICEMSSVSKTLRSIANSDEVWSRFLPSICQCLIPQSLRNSSNKDQFHFLCDHPILIDSGRKSFSLDKHTGKISFMLSARDLAIKEGATPEYWQWFSGRDDTRFGEAVQLVRGARLGIQGDIQASVLSDDTAYTIFLVYKLTKDAIALERPLVVTMRLGWREYPKRKIHLMMGETHTTKRVGLFQRKPTLFSVLKDNPYPHPRKDGWLEVELGRFRVKRGDDMDVTVVIRDNDGGSWKSGLVIQGIDIRPQPASICLGAVPFI